MQNPKLRFFKPFELYDYTSYGHPLPPDLPLLFSGSPKVGLGLYNSMSAVEATVLELGMFLLGLAVYVSYIVKKRRNRRPSKG